MAATRPAARTTLSLIEIGAQLVSRGRFYLARKLVKRKYLRRSVIRENSDFIRMARAIASWGAIK
jgi:hypothetical protein